MKQVAYWIFILILVYLLVSYYKGTSSVLDAIGSFVGTLVLYLQGRDKQGHTGGYATGA